MKNNVMRNSKLIYSLLFLLLLASVLFYGLIIHIFLQPNRPTTVERNVDGLLLTLPIFCLILELMISTISFWLFKSTKKTFYSVILLFNQIPFLSCAINVIFALIFLGSKKVLRADINCTYKTELLPFSEEKLKWMTVLLWLSLMVDVTSIIIVPIFFNKHFWVSFLLISAIIGTMTLILINVTSKVVYFRRAHHKVSKWFWIDAFSLSFLNHSKYTYKGY